MCRAYLIAHQWVTVARDWMQIYVEFAETQWGFKGWNVVAWRLIRSVLWVTKALRWTQWYN
jgi:hypothetical protein